MGMAEERAVRLARAVGATAAAELLAVAAHTARAEALAPAV